MPGQVKYLYIDLDFRANAAACFAMHIKNAPVTHLKISLRLYKLRRDRHCDHSEQTCHCNRKAAHGTFYFS
jgi:hypothetical protein